MNIGFTGYDREIEMLLIDEALISPFKFWHDGRVQQGMHFRKRLFGQFRCFDRHDRQQAFDLSARFVDAGVEVVMTTTGSQYTLWISLHSPQPSMQ
jgi:hypothetical protein